MRNKIEFLLPQNSQSKIQSSTQVQEIYLKSAKEKNDKKMQNDMISNKRNPEISKLIFKK